MSKYSDTKPCVAIFFALVPVCVVLTANYGASHVFRTESGHFPEHQKLYRLSPEHFQKGTQKPENY